MTASNKKVLPQIKKNCLDQCGLINSEIGATYMSDHVQRNGKIAESAIDHVYHSIKMEKNPTTTTNHRLFIIGKGSFIISITQLGGGEGVNTCIQL